MEQTLERPRVKGFEQFLTPEDIAILLQRPVRYVREQLLKTKVLPATKTGGNSWRVAPEAFRKWMAQGCPTGAKFAKPSGRWRDGSGKR